MKIIARGAMFALVLGGLSACEGERTAEADTPVSEAEVSTELPETVVSDAALNATANAAAQVAATPPAQIVPVPVPVGGTASPGATGQQNMTANQMTGTGNAQ